MQEVETMANHNLVEAPPESQILVEKKPALDVKGQPVDGLHNLWITLNNPKQYNSYTTEMVKEVILAIRAASNDRSAVCVVFTGAGDKAFCTGGNVKEYAEYYAGRPLEYRQYMRLFNDMVTALLHCDKPVICRVNGMRVGGGQEIGMACDYSVASDLAMFSQAGPKHGSAPDGGSTDFLPIMIGMEQGMVSGTLCESWSAHKFFRMGGLTQIVPALKVNGEWTANPMAITDKTLDEFGRPVLGEFRTGADRAAAKEVLKSGEVDLSLLDQEVEALCTKLLYTMPDCLIKTIESLRKHKLAHWDRNRETNRAWLSLNMNTEAKAGFRAFAFGTKETGREADFVKLRQRLAEGARWNDDLVKEIAPWAEMK